ncbi:MAG: peptidase domain-containing ABC transporter [Acidaminococcaceae bacterium]
MIFKKRFPLYLQYDAMDCGPTCLRMIAKHYGQEYPLAYLRTLSYADREGTSLLCLRDAAEKIGMNAKCALISLADLSLHAPLPCIVHWDHEHFVVVYQVSADGFTVADPAIGEEHFTTEEFLSHWAINDEKGYALLMEPTAAFYQLPVPPAPRTGFSDLLVYLKEYKHLLLRLFLLLLLGSMIQLALPFLAQALVDSGVQKKDLGLLELILFGQLLLMFSRASVSFLRGWFLFHISTPLNIKLVHDFLVKLTKLPLRFFDVKMVGDTLQRIGDHQRIELFLTSSVLNIFLTILNLLVFGTVLAVYSLPIFAIFIAGTLCYLAWLKLFLAKRRALDFDKFKQMGKNQSQIIQLIMGMQEIKLNNCEQQKIKAWVKLQDGLFKVGRKAMSLNQKQETGCFLLQETQNIVITYWSARSVINDDISLGMMLAIQFILGQLNGPVEQLMHFITMAQDAKISLERIEEVKALKEDADPQKQNITEIAPDVPLILRNVSFQYGSPYAEKVLQNISLTIPQKKTTAIVGASGSGKTTLLKLMLGVYEPVEGLIFLGSAPLNKIQKKVWRQKCGSVLQEGYIFSDTIANNITMSDAIIDKEQLKRAVQLANIEEFIDSLPLKYTTIIGADGQGLSQGQKQRILIARAAYKNPHFIFFDEATNALDTNNEAIIMNNLEQFFLDKTVVIVAHRLSTVRNADQIIVLEKGKIIETGTHAGLIAKKGAYYDLVKNQLELSN